jgi:hypothetical protein
VDGTNDDLALYGRVLAAYSGQGSIRLETGETLGCAFSVGQLADGTIILLPHTLAGSMSWPPGPLASFEGTTPQGAQLVSGGRGLTTTDLRTRSAAPSLAFDLPSLTAHVSAAHPATEARFGLTSFILAPDTRAPLTLHAPAGVLAVELVAVSDAEHIVRRIRTLRTIDVTCEVRVPLAQGVTLERIHEQTHILCRALSIANGSRVEWVYCDLYDTSGARIERQHRNHVTKRYTGCTIIDYRNGWTPDVQRFTEEAFRLLATDTEPLLRPSILESLYDARAQEDFLEARGAKVAVTLEMLRWTLVASEGRREPEPLVEWPVFEALTDDLRAAIAAILDAHRIPPKERKQLLKARSLRRLNQAGAQGGDFGRMLQQLNVRIGLRADADTIERVTRSRHALVHEGKFYCQLAPTSRPASLPPLASPADEYFFLVAFLDRLILALLRYQGPYLDWSVPGETGYPPAIATFS